MIKKVVIIGPESTGKSSLCELLAQHYASLWCPEFAREYLVTNGKDYDFDDLLFIAKGQLALEDEYTQLMQHQWSMVKDQTPNGDKIKWINSNTLITTRHSPILFIDTDMYVMKVWCEYVFQKCHQFILEEIVKRKYDLYLLCDTDLPWIKDDLREYPDEKTRRELYQMYKDLLTNQQVPWIAISGSNAERTLDAVDKYLR
jgi:NadR type nicotinamide-nucleotide adenylyltransferase